VGVPASSWPFCTPRVGEEPTHLPEERWWRSGLWRIALRDEFSGRRFCLDERRAGRVIQLDRGFNIFPSFYNSSVRDFAGFLTLTGPALPIEANGPWDNTDEEDEAVLAALLKVIPRLRRLDPPAFTHRGAGWPVILQSWRLDLGDWCTVRDVIRGNERTLTADQ
jgi:hypothetical protein